MDIEQLYYDLPAELIAQRPVDNRSDSRLLVLNRGDGSLTDDKFINICNYFRKGDCLVLNNTKVLPAKFYAQKINSESPQLYVGGAKLEGLFIEQQADNWLVLLKNSSKIKEGQTLSLLDRNGKPFCPALAEKKLSNGQWLLLVQHRRDSCLAPTPAVGVQSRDSLSRHSLATADEGTVLKTPEEILNTIGFTPLPPYIKRPIPQAEHQTDSQRYQTVYASDAGAIAAPTAGLHFTEKILEQISDKGISIARLTLHVGIGTFLPVKTKTLAEHKIHSEQFSLDAQNACLINKTIQAGGRIIAVGTTSVRTLETAAAARSVKPAGGQTNLFITPGFNFNITDCLITNFHLPKSTLLALVAAFAGLDQILAAYKHAVERKYRFYSYGDCMLII